MAEKNRGVLVWNRSKTQRGSLTGGERRCQLEGCGSVRLGVRWPDGKLTWPCMRGMNFDTTTNTWELL
jgi:hypothetical protein